MFELSSIRDAMEPVRQEYWNDVRAIAQEILDEHYPNESNMNDAIHEQVDGNWWITYTFASQAVLMVSDNDGAVEEYGMETAVEDGCIRWSALAYCAMAADVREHLDALISRRQEEGAEDEDDA